MKKGIELRRITAAFMCIIMLCGSALAEPANGSVNETGEESVRRGVISAEQVAKMLSEESSNLLETGADVDSAAENKRAEEPVRRGVISAEQVAKMLSEESSNLLETEANVDSAAENESAEEPQEEPVRRGVVSAEQVAKMLSEESSNLLETGADVDSAAETESADELFINAVPLMMSTLSTTTCAHETTEQANAVVTYSYSSDTHHTVTTTYDTVCLSCGETVSTGESQQEDAVHELKTDGSCNFCDYVAEVNPMQISISNATQGMDMIISWSEISGVYYEYTVLNETTDTYYYQNEQTSEIETYIEGENIIAGNSYKVWVGAYSYAGKVLCQATKTVTATVFDDGSSNGCEHLNTTKTTLSTEYEYYSETDHHVLVVEEVFCTDCNTPIGEDAWQYGVEHNFDENGVCQDCGYASETEPQILTLSVGSAVEGQALIVSWNDIEGMDHYQYNVRDLTKDVAIWGETGESTTNTALTLDGVFVEEAHEYKIWVAAYDADGTQICSTEYWVTAGAAQTNSLGLTYETPLAGVALDVSWTDMSDADHYEYSLRDVTTDTLHYNREETTKAYLTISGSLLEAGHEYKLWVGAIGADGAEPDGDHQATVTFTVEECLHGSPAKDNEVTTYTSVSDTLHHVVSTYDLYCTYCDTTVETGKTEEYEEEHSFDELGDCTLCDYTVGCAHEETKRVDTASNYVRYDEAQHKLVVNYQTVCANAECGKVIVELQAETTYLDHEFDGDTCTDCGYTKNAELTATVTREAASAIVGELMAATVSANGGSGSYSYSWKITCDGETIHEEAFDHRASYTATKAGAWVFTVTVTDKNSGETVTASCDAITVTDEECAHEKTTETVIDTTYIKASDTQHEIQQTIKITCDGCSLVINSGYLKSTYEAHAYIDGVCICGVSEPGSCAHEGDVITEKVSEAIEQHNADKHKVITVYRDICDDCRSVLTAAREQSALEVHTYEDGKCVCGQLEPTDECDHAPTKTLLETKYAQLDGDNENHVVIETYQYACACGALNEQKDETRNAEHALTGRTCDLCGYIVPCDHTPIETRGTSTIERNWDDDSNTHYVVTPITVTCDCGQLSEQKTEKVPVEHDYSYTGNEYAHPHKEFKRCVCQVTIETGNYGKNSSCSTCYPPEQEEKEETFICNHIETLVGESVSYSNYTGAAHIKSITTSYRCACGQEGYNETEFITESHSTSDGVCQLCGAKTNTYENSSVPKSKIDDLIEKANDSVAQSYTNLAQSKENDVLHQVSSEALKILNSPIGGTYQAAAGGVFGAQEKEVLERAVVEMLYGAEYGNTTYSELAQIVDNSGAFIGDFAFNVVDDAVGSMEDSIDKIIRSKADSMHYAFSATGMSSEELKNLDLSPKKYTTQDFDRLIADFDKYTENAIAPPGSDTWVRNQQVRADLVEMRDLTDSGKVSDLKKKLDVTGVTIDAVFTIASITVGFMEASEWNDAVKQSENEILYTITKEKLQKIEILTHLMSKLDEDSSLYQACKTVRSDITKDLEGFASTDTRKAVVEAGEDVVDFTCNVTISIQSAKAPSGVASTLGNILTTVAIANFASDTLTKGAIGGAVDYSESLENLCFVHDALLSMDTKDMDYFETELYYTLAKKQLDYASEINMLTHENSLVSRRDEEIKLKNDMGIIETQKDLLDAQNAIRAEYFANNGLDFKAENKYDAAVVGKYLDEKYDLITGDKEIPAYANVDAWNATGEIQPVRYFDWKLDNNSKYEITAVVEKDNEQYMRVVDTQGKESYIKVSDVPDGEEIIKEKYNLHIESGTYVPVYLINDTGVLGDIMGDPDSMRPNSDFAYGDYEMIRVVKYGGEYYYKVRKKDGFEWYLKAKDAQKFIK